MEKQRQLYIIIKNNNGNLFLDKTGNEILDGLIKNLLEKEPTKRLSWDEYFNHQFFKITNKKIMDKNNKMNDDINFY